MINKKKQNLPKISQIMRIGIGSRQFDRRVECHAFTVADHVLALLPIIGSSFPRKRKRSASVPTEDCCGIFFLQLAT